MGRRIGTRTAAGHGSRQPRNQNPWSQDWRFDFAQIRRLTRDSRIYQYCNFKFAIIAPDQKATFCGAIE